jgi:hypothetical protein
MEGSNVLEGLSSCFRGNLAGFPGRCLAGPAISLVFAVWSPCSGDDRWRGLFEWLAARCVGGLLAHAADRVRTGRRAAISPGINPARFLDRLPAILVCATLPAVR